MRDTDLFQLALVPPWLVTRSDFDAAARRLDIHIDFAESRPCEGIAKAGGGRFCVPELRRRRLPALRH
jgi:hypothetical protein